MLVVITSGGVKEKIDNVRSITNSSSGKLGMKIARNFLENYSECKVIYIYGGNAKPCDGAENIYIKDTENLLDVVSHILTTNKVDIFVHSMAVADYTTSAVIDIEKLKEAICSANKTISENDFECILSECSIENNGKMSSYMNAPAIMLKKTPKVIEHIKKLSPYTFLVGFKLLDNVSEEELFDVGFNLLRKNRCNLVLANDIANIRNGNHVGMLIYPEKNYDIIEGKDKIAEFIVKQSVERYSVKHPKSIQVNSDNNISDDIFDEFYNMGKWLNQGNFLPRVVNHDRTDKIGTYGNMSLRHDDSFYITCRNVDKANLKRSDLSFISNVDTENLYPGVYSVVHYNSVIKPSIDTAIHFEIYKHTNYSHIVHIHTNNIFLGYPLVEKAYPCGSDAECNAIIDIILKNHDVDIIQMRKHGLIILGNSFEECKEKITNLFLNVPYIDYDDNDIPQECSEHIEDVSVEFSDSKSVYVLKMNGLPIGCLFEKIDDRFVHFGLYTMSHIRGKKLNIVKKYLSLYNKEYMLHTTTGCSISDFYKAKYGFVDYDVRNQHDLQFVKKAMIDML